MKKLIENTKFYIRSFINSEAGIVYSKSFYFTTLGRPQFTSNQTTSSITRTSAILNAQVNTENGGQISEYGFISGASKYISTNISSDLKFTYDLNSLVGNTQYDFKAFATNKYGTSYSENFKFLSGPTEPVVSTGNVTDIYSNLAVGLVTISSDGGSGITESGICLSTKSQPTISDRIYPLFTAYTGTGTKSILSNLSYDSTYYVRSFAKNNVGVGYGEEKTFTTIYKVGETGPAGGIIFYDQGIKKNGWRYMETTKSDIDALAPGGCYTTISITTDSAIGTGLENTNKIIELCSEAGISARVAKNFTLNNYKDWFLPSFNELLAIFDSNPGRNFTDKAGWKQSVQNGGGNYYLYQSSTFSGVISQQMIYFGNWWSITYTNSGRQDNNYVRPVRRFQ